MKFLLMSLCCLLPMAAQNRSTAEQPISMSVHGESTVSVEPDIAELDVGVISQAQTSQAAADENTAKSKRLVTQLEPLVAPGEIKSINLSINPNFLYAKDGGAGVITGYTANNTLRLAIRDMSQLRKVIEAATQAGASSIDRLTFGLKDENGARAQALAQAAHQAQSGAEALASSLKLRIGNLIRVEEVQPVVISPAREVEVAELKAAAADQAAIAPGTIQIHASVNLVYAAYKR